MTHLLLIALATLAFVSLVGWLWQWRVYRRNIDKLTFMFDALDNLDNSFRFTETKGSKETRLFNKALNRIKRLIEEARAVTADKERYYAHIIERVETGIMVMNDGGHVLRHNRAAEQLLGLSALTHITQVKTVSEAACHAMTVTDEGERNLVTIHHERGERHLVIIHMPIALQGERLSLVTINDVDREMNKNEMDSWIRLTRVLTHEIMNSVAPIISLADTLRTKADALPPEKLPKDWRVGIDTIYKTGTELMTFVENYRKFTHIPTPQPALFYVAPFVERMVNTSRGLVNDKRIGFEMDVRPDNLIVYADEQLIGHVVGNILKNAVQAIAEEGRIVVSAWADEKDAVHITIGNNGEPIAQEVAEQIFVPFFTTKHDGSGVGLSIARQIMRLSGGTISLHNDAKKGLTIFELIFP